MKKPLIGLAVWALFVPLAGCTPETPATSAAGSSISSGASQPETASSSATASAPTSASTPASEPSSSTPSSSSPSSSGSSGQVDYGNGLDGPIALAAVAEDDDSLSFHTFELGTGDLELNLKLNNRHKYLDDWGNFRIRLDTDDGSGWLVQFAPVAASDGSRLGRVISNSFSDFAKESAEDDYMADADIAINIKRVGGLVIYSAEYQTNVAGYTGSNATKHTVASLDPDQNLNLSVRTTGADVVINYLDVVEQPVAFTANTDTPMELNNIEADTGEADKEVYFYEQALPKDSAPQVVKASFDNYGVDDTWGNYRTWLFRNDKLDDSGAMVKPYYDAENGTVLFHSTAFMTVDYSDWNGGNFKDRYGIGWFDDADGTWDFGTAMADATVTMTAYRDGNAFYASFFYVSNVAEPAGYAGRTAVKTIWGTIPDVDVTLSISSAFSRVVVNSVETGLLGE